MENDKNEQPLERVPEQRVHPAEKHEAMRALFKLWYERGDLDDPIARLDKE